MCLSRCKIRVSGGRCHINIMILPPCLCAFCVSSALPFVERPTAYHLPETLTYIQLSYTSLTTQVVLILSIVPYAVLSKILCPYSTRVQYLSGVADNAPRSRVVCAFWPREKGHATPKRRDGVIQERYLPMGALHTLAGTLPWRTSGVKILLLLLTLPHVLTNVTRPTTPLSPFGLTTSIGSQARRGSHPLVPHRNET